MRLLLFAVTAALMLSGCNTYFENGYQKIVILTPGVDNAECDLYTDTNRYSAMTPRLVLVERSNLPLTVICKKTGYYTASTRVKSKVYAPAMPLNVLNGLLPGATYDVASNSIYNYPDTIIVTLLPMPPVKDDPQPAPYVLQKRPEEVKPAPVTSAPPAAAADEYLDESGKK